MPSPTIDLDALKQKALTFRREILEILCSAGSGHPGGSLSAVEILISLYEHKLRYKATDPHWDDRDRLIISKGHATPVVYVTLANYGFFSKKEYPGYRKFGSILQGHVHKKVPGVEFNTGSLGHGLSVANGIALANKLLKSDSKTYCLLGDGEIQEGSVWEAAMMAAHNHLDNVCAIVDYNKVQENGPTNDIKNLEPLADKWRSFGWEVREIDGHNFEQILKALNDFGKTPKKPFVIVANTIKGKGVKYMEGQAKWHGKAPNKEQLEQALKDLEGSPA